ncbi:phosphatase PAP2 family protein [Dechloromonas sp. HYN0024]|uniref:phosphatase PAP2 family protein n=1 Tax=Dechloromonas sp. HYN0024 TaxID=2231055 RepID=UPI0013C32C2D|nr:phosphatase PAP2 family protein [Dechloromonas sp. HYN0024]
MPSRVIELRIAGVVFALLAVLFVAFPEIDLATSGHFYKDGRWAFSDGNWPLFELLYRGTPRAGQVLLIILTGGLLLGTFKRLPWLQARRTTLGFLLAAALLGPVLLVDATLKDGWHRARPTTVTEFGGPLKFTPAFMLSDQCVKNCSFVSGHVATAAFVMAFGWLATPAVRRRWLLTSLATASLLALVRLTAGGHFLSDTLFAWFATYFSLWLTEWIFRRLKWLPPVTD